MRLGLGIGLTFGRPPIQDPWVDPLAAYTFGLRLQAHRGDGVPLGLYQDTACTVKALVDGDPVAAWRDEISGSGFKAEQSNAMKQPTLRFVGGLPLVRFDGVDDTMVVTGFTADYVSTVLVRMRILSEGFCKPWNHSGVQSVQSYQNGSNELIMSSGANGPKWTTDVDTAYTHQCYYDGASSSWKLDGAALATGDVGASGAPSGNFLLSDTIGGVPATEMDVSFISLSAGSLLDPSVIHSYLATLQ